MTQNNPVTINIDGSSLYANSQLLGLYNITGGDNITFNDNLINVDQDPSFNTLTVSGDIISKGRNILNDIDTKQNTLTAGTDLEISGNTINYTGTGGGDTIDASSNVVLYDLTSHNKIEVLNDSDDVVMKLEHQGVLGSKLRLYNDAGDNRVTLSGETGEITADVSITSDSLVGSSQVVSPLFYNSSTQSNNVASSTRKDYVDGLIATKQDVINKPMFHVTNETNGNVTFGNSPSTIPFNSINPAGCFEIGSGYNYTTYKYTIPKSGIWRMSLRVFINTSSTTVNARISLLKNDLIIATVGNKIGNAESLEILYDFSLNDVLETTAERMIIWMGHGHSYWTGEWVCNSDGTI